MNQPATPRIALLGFSIECNRFAPVATETDFRTRTLIGGAALVAEARSAAPGMLGELPGFIAAMDAVGPWQPVPSLLAMAEPNGPVEQAFFDQLMQCWEADLTEAGRLDGVYLVLHGAGLTTGDHDPEGTLLALVRRIVGPSVPVVATYDLHANVSDADVTLVNGFIGYRTNPHLDMRERGGEAAALLRLLLGGTSSFLARVRLPIVPPTVTQLTGQDVPNRPYGELIDLGQQRMREAPYAGRVLNVSVMGGFTYADTPFNGLTVVVTATDQPAADALADEIAIAGWDRRDRFRPSLTSLEDAVRLAKGTEAPATPSLIFADVADNPGGGGRGNTMAILQAFQAAGVSNALVGVIHDPELAQEAHAIGIGVPFQAHFNRGGGDAFSKPFTASAVVTGLRDQPITGRRGIYARNTLDLGKAASLTIDGITVIVLTNRYQCADPIFFEAFGLDIAAARVVVVKSRGHFRGGFDEFFRHDQVIEVDAPGLTSPVLSPLRLAPHAATRSADRRHRDMDTKQGDTTHMMLADLPTPCLVLDRTVLQRNIRGMAAALSRLKVPLRPHMKTAKSIEVARLATAGQPGGITVSTLAEAEYFLSHGMTDILYAVGITPQRLERTCALNSSGGQIIVITDDPDMADMIAAQPVPPRTLIEIDSGEERGGVHPESDMLLELAARLGGCLAGVMTHAGHSYAGGSVREIARIAEAERRTVTGAAARLRAAGFTVDIVSAGSSPTARHAENLAGITEIRAGVYMFGDLFQAEIQTHGDDAIAVTVLASVIGRRPGRLLVDAGGLALSKDRSTEATPHDYGYGLALDIAGTRAFGTAVVRNAYQEHGVIGLDPAHSVDLPIGAKLRIAPNHTCMTVAAHDRYFVVDGDQEVVAIWHRVNGW